RYDRPEKGKKISVFLGISVENVIWDRYLNRLRVHGIICDAPEEIGALGSHHTLNIELNKALTIVKDEWMSYHIDQLDRAKSKEVSPIIIISIDDEGYCIAVLRSFGLEMKAEEKMNLPGKMMAEERAETLQKFFKSATKTLEETLSTFQSPIVVIGLGFIKNYFVNYLEANAPKIRERIVDIKSVNSVGKAGIYEAMRSGILSKALKHARISEETASVEEVLKRLGKGETTVTYGLAEVVKANTLGAIEELLLTDITLREASDDERRSLEKLMREVEEKRGKITIVSVEHEAGIKLNSLGGIAALLRFPIN
ncbi:MAG: mRNA surveillance protein pelota, partial [Candidatus Bathyarchaeia archaeon]